MQKKTDRRVRKTKSQLKTGLAQLMREKSIREITVKELVDAVDINRSTFYLHYSDIPGLLAEVENEMMEEMQRAIREHPIDPGKDTVYYFIQDLFHVLDENRQIASALVGPHGDIGFGIYPDLSGMCHWLGKCLAFSVYYRKVWRSSICSDLSAVSCSVGIANHGNGIRSGSWKSGKYCTIL